MVKDIIVGYGQIGQAVHEVICPDAHTYDINQKNRKAAPVGVMHICFPYSEDFVEQVKGYITRYEPQRIAIWSTVPIGTTDKFPQAVHTPVEGVHPNLAKSIKLMPRWIGYNRKMSGAFFEHYFKERHLQVRLVPNTRYTEALKLLSTTEYGLNIVFADYKAEVAKAIGMDYQLTKDWNKDYNQLYKELGLKQFQKFILDPPKGKIGGHCVVPNAAILDKQFPNDLPLMIREL
jgi:hypothetical protein